MDIFLFHSGTTAVAADFSSCIRSISISHTRSSWHFFFSFFHFYFGTLLTMCYYIFRRSLFFSLNFIFNLNDITLSLARSFFCGNFSLLCVCVCVRAHKNCLFYLVALLAKWNELKWNLKASLFFFCLRQPFSSLRSSSFVQFIRFFFFRLPCLGWLFLFHFNNSFNTVQLISSRRLFGLLDFSLFFSLP